MLGSVRGSILGTVLGLHSGGGGGGGGFNPVTNRARIGANVRTQGWVKC